jgi:hypothetical protein
VATLVVLRSVAARNEEVPILALLNVVALNAALLSAAAQIAVTHAAVPNVVVLSVAPLSLVQAAVRNVVLPDVVPNVAAQSAAIQFWFQVVIRVAPTAVLISVPYEARPVVCRASRVHDGPYQASRVAAP